MSDDALPKLTFPPAPRFAYWPWSVACMGFYLWILWTLGAFETFANETLAEYLERLGFTMLIMGLFPLMAVVFLFLPPGRTGVKVTSEGLVFEPAGRRKARTLPWAAIERIERRMQYRRPDSLLFRVREGHGDGFGTSYRLIEDLYHGTHIELLSAMREVAPRSGYELKGHRLDIQHWGGEEWWLEPMDQRAS